MPYSDWHLGRIEELKREMGASDVSFDLTGVTLMVKEKPIFISVTSIRAMSALMTKAEDEAVERMRSELEADRAGASPS